MTSSNDKKEDQKPQDTPKDEKKAGNPSSNLGYKGNNPGGSASKKS